MTLQQMFVKVFLLFCRTIVFVHIVHKITFGKQKCNFYYKCLFQSVLRILHLAFGGIVWPVLVWSRKAPPPRHMHNLAARGIGPVQSGWSSYKHLSLSFRTHRLNNASTKGRQKNSIVHSCEGYCFAVSAHLIVTFL